ncbi:hypothetical protein [Kamptonema formosum]|uniref:hypothetical protein n=1 Tax=Kamptonema formosum TaxID=331992 RepID=UPI0003477B90|nr:hypothetical protein [Oscillatoria sp. PCC 10802]
MKKLHSSKVIAAAFVIQAAMIGVQGSLRVWYGDPLLDIIPWMAVQGAALIIEAAKETEPKSPSDK